MATCTEKSASNKAAAAASRTEAAFVYGHDSKKLRLRAVSAEANSFSKYISKPIAKKISWTQIVIASLICIMQIVTISLVTGRYSYYDSMASVGGGLWSSLLTTAAAILTLWSLKNPKYWKLHLSFALHIVGMLASVIILICEFGGNIQYMKNRIGNALYGDDDGGYYGSKKEISTSMLTACLILNTFMATGTLIQLVSSFVMTLMTGRALCCGQSKTHGKLFELEIAGSETADGLAIVRNNLQGIGNMIPTSAVLTAAANSAPPPPYMDSLVDTA